MFEETSEPFAETNAQDLRWHEALSEPAYGGKWFLELTFRQAVISIASYHCARGNCSLGRDLLQQIIEDDRHDEDTRLILEAFLYSCPCGT